MASRKTSPPKPAKAVVEPKRTAKAIVKDLRTGLKDLRAIDPEHPWAVLLKDAVVAIQEQQRLLNRALAVFHEQQATNLETPARLATVLQDSREGRVQVLGELEQIRAHLARFIDAGIRERGRDERIEAQLAGINERLKERSRDGRVVRHGKTTTAETLSRELDAMERAKSEAEAISGELKLKQHAKDKEISGLRCELDATRRAKAEQGRDLVNEIERLRSELEAARDPLDHRRMPPPRKSWRTTAAEKSTVAPLD